MEQYGTWIYVILIVAFMYFFVIAPGRKQSKAKQELMKSLQKNVKVITASGIHGRITSVKEETVNLEIAYNVVITIEKSAIATILGTEQAAKKISEQEEQTEEDVTEEISTEEK